MYSSGSIHNMVMKEYSKKQEKYQNDLRVITEEIHNSFPEVKEIDKQISLLALKHANRIISENITPQDAVDAVKVEKDELLKRRNAILSGKTFAYPKHECELCSDTGEVNGQRCSCYMNLTKQFLASRLDGTKNILVDVENDTFEKFSLDWYSKEIVDNKIMVSPYEIMKIAYSKAISFCENFANDFSNLYFYGKSGTGKTFLASCIANELIRKGYKVVYQTSYKLFQFLEDYKFCRIDRESNLKDYENIYNCDLLIIDDLGTEFGTAYTCSVLFDILNTRLLNSKSTIISTNLTFPNLESKYTERVHSRIVGNFDVIRFLGDDIRILKKQNR